jgi:hypothetical protein
MNSIWYGLAMLAIIFVVHWYIKSETAGDLGTQGFFAMKPQGAARDRKSRRRKKFSIGEK